MDKIKIQEIALEGRDIKSSLKFEEKPKKEFGAFPKWLKRARAKIR